jgi:tetratricopeptide (TPR) repeat protein
VFTASIERDPRDVDAYIGRGVARHVHGQAHGAIADFGEAMRLAPRGSIAHGNRAAALAQKGELDRALADYTAAIERHRDVAGLLADTRWGQERGSLVAVKHLRGRADVWRLKRNHDMALADYTEALLLDPADASSLLGRGIIFGEKGQFGQALADLTEAIRLSPVDPRGYKNRGYFLSLQGNHARAIADFDEAIRLGPDDAQSYLWRGTIRALRVDTRRVSPHDSGETDSQEAGAARGLALADFNAAIRLAPSDPMAYRCRAAALARLGDHEQALADYDAAIRLDLNHPGSAGARAELLAVERKL